MILSSGIYFNRSWRYLRTILQDESTVGYRLSISKIKKFKAFSIGTTFDQLIAAQQRKSWQQKRERLKKGTSEQIVISGYGYYPVANKAYAEIFDLSESTASRYRQLAKDAGWIEVKHVYKKVTTLVRYNEDRPPIKEYLGTGLVFKNGKYYIQEVSQIRSKMHRKRLPALNGKN
ncbi:MAG: hypothetical protein R2879_00525 [Saprospiraceae bacterium]